MSIAHPHIEIKACFHNAANCELVVANLQRFPGDQLHTHVKVVQNSAIFNSALGLL